MKKIGYTAVDSSSGLDKIVQEFPIFHLEDHARKWIKERYPERVEVTYKKDVMPTGQTYDIPIPPIVVAKVEYDAN